MTSSTGISRRSVLVGAAATGAAVAAGGTAQARERTGPGTPAGTRIGPNDPRYAGFVTGNNKRFVARPDWVHLVTGAADAERALTEAVRAGKRVVVRSGGHCFSDFTSNPDVEVILDMSTMDEIGYDPSRRAFVVEPGARLLRVYEELSKGWNVTIPGGICYSVGIGGHIAGGGYGLLSRAHGLTVDHLYAVEVVVWDPARNRARTVVATREPTDPNRDLLWAHAGGGGGNFGVVTRYWFRSRDAHGSNPSDQLISPPSTVLVSAIEFPWEQLTEKAFTRLIDNFGRWHAANSSPDSPYTALSSLFNVSHKAHGSMGMFTQVDGDLPNARRLLDTYVAAITAGTGVTPRDTTRPIGEVGNLPGHLVPRRYSWLDATRMVGTNNPTITNPTSRGAHKSAYQKKPFTKAQVATLFKYMSGADGSGFANPDTMLVLFSFGGAVNAMRSDETANAQRDTIFKMCFQTFWPDREQDALQLGWLRGLYEEFYGSTGGVPVPNGASDGCYINYPDNDVADPAHNKSGVPWSTLYYKDNYPRLQQVKRRWDPANVFHHALGIEP